MIVTGASFGPLCGESPTGTSNRLSAPEAMELRNNRNNSETRNSFIFTPQIDDLNGMNRSGHLFSFSYCFTSS